MSLIYRVYSNLQIRITFSYHNPKRTIFRSNRKKNKPPGNLSQNIDIITCNIEGLKTNVAFLHTLELSNTLLCLQEHILPVLVYYKFILWVSMINLSYWT